MKTLHSTFMLLLAVSYQGQCRHCVRVALDAKREGEPTAFWLGRAKWLASEAKGYVAQWRMWTAAAA